jgi:DNA-binding CsgD family transcriptional regulator
VLLLYCAICPPAAALIVAAFWPLWNGWPLLALGNVILSMALLCAGILLLDEPGQRSSAGMLLGSSVRLLSHQRQLSKLDRLTDAEQDMLAHLAEGRSNRAIHKITNLTEKTIESYITRIYVKLDIPGTPDDNRRVLAVLAWMRGA